MTYTFPDPTTFAGEFLGATSPPQTGLEALIIAAIDSLDARVLLREDGGIDVGAVKSADWTFGLADTGHVILANKATPFTATLPTNAAVPMPVRTTFTILVTGPGALTFALGGGGTVTREEIPGVPTGGTVVALGQGAWVQITKIATNKWAFVGAFVVRERAVIPIPVTPLGADAIVEDAQGYFRVPRELAGYSLDDVVLTAFTPSSSGIVTVPLRRRRAGAFVDMLTVPLTLPVGATDSVIDAGVTAAVINASVADLAEGDLIIADVDGAGTGTRGLYVQATAN